MKRNFLTGFVVGALIFGSIAAFSQGVIYQAEKNIYPVQLNGQNVSIDGYNIDGYTYFKLRDISAVVGDFDVDFQNDTILLSKDGYTYSQTTALINWNDMIGEYEGDYMNTIYLENISGSPYLTLATYRGSDDISGELTVLEDGSLFYFNGGTRSFTLKFIDANTIELVDDTWDGQLTGKYTKQASYATHSADMIDTYNLPGLYIGNYGSEYSLSMYTSPEDSEVGVLEYNGNRYTVYSFDGNRYKAINGNTEYILSFSINNGIPEMYIYENGTLKEEASMTEHYRS